MADTRLAADLNGLPPPAVTGVHASLHHVAAAIVVIGIGIVAVVVIVAVRIEAGAECEAASITAMESAAEAAIVESTGKTAAMKAMATTLSKPTLYRAAGKAGRWFIKHMPWLVNNKLNAWYKQREMPAPPKTSFGEWYRKNRKNG